MLRNGRRRYDPASKQRPVEAYLQPGVSLAGLALQHGVNANLLRKWVAKRQHQNGMASRRRGRRLRQTLFRFARRRRRQLDLLAQSRFARRSDPVQGG
ncbi:transposase [Bradyrhizobium cytisi]|uniref:transposase n=1 Tax=Bradyrhizobium cytisi TaxID=515489 RepID=UPI003D316A50